jgi:DNA-binding protein YbaB
LENRSKKDRWDKTGIILKVIMPVVIAGIGGYFTSTYKSAQNELARTQIEIQNELTKTQIESGILKSLISGNENERKLAIEFALLIAQKFGDKDFERIVLEISGTKDPSPEVRKVAEKQLLQTIRGILKSANISFNAGHFYDAAQEYESATRFIPPDVKVDKSLLDKARSEIESDPKLACINYRKFFSRFIE